MIKSDKKKPEKFIVLNWWNSFSFFTRKLELIQTLILKTGLIVVANKNQGHPFGIEKIK